MGFFARITGFLSRNKYKLGGAIIALFLLLSSMTIVIEHLARAAIMERLDQYATRKGVVIHFEDFSMTGFTEFHFRGLSVVPSRGDTLLCLRNMKIRLRFLPLLVLRPNVSSVDLEGLNARFVKKEGYCNYDFLFANKPTSELDSSTGSSMDFSKVFHRLFDLFFRVTPDRLTMIDTRLSSYNMGYHTQLMVDHVHLNDHALHATISIVDSTEHHTWIAEGRLDKSGKNMEGLLHGATEHDTLCIPYFDKVYGAKVFFKSLRFALSVESSSSREVDFTASLSTDGLRMNYWRLSPTDIVPGRVSFDLSCRALPHVLEVDSTSTFRLNDITLHPYLALRKNRDWGVQCSFHERNISAQTFLNSLPKGVFNVLDKVTLKGEFDYRFYFDLDLERPDSLRFEAEVPKHSVEIIHDGDLSKLNRPFLHTAYVRQRPVRTFMVGESNPNYRSLSSISPLLQHAVLQSEDGQFYGHLGFQPEALREALIHDLKVGRFARGGSTITMQLVKNVFLNSNKNLFRKVEEAAIVWLLEHKRIVSKERMFEVYLNIIEWGPMIYGVEEAARFYFDKSAAELDLQESLFLSSIIPNPAHFQFAFDSATGAIKENRESHFRRVAHRLAKSGLISEETAKQLIPSVSLKGASRSFLIQRDSTLSGDSESPDERISTE